MNPHVALLIAQVIGSFNSVISRAAFVVSSTDDLETHVPTPLTFAVWRVLIASTVLTILRYFIVKRPRENKAYKLSSVDILPVTTNTQQYSSKKKFDDDADDEKKHEETNITSPISPSSTPAAAQFFKNSVVKSLQATASPTSSEYNLFAPTPHSSVALILQTCLLGAVIITGNFAMWFFGVELTDAITLAAMMCTIPPICFVIGFMLGMETFTIPKALSTILVVCGNFVMAHAWRMFYSSSSTTHNVLEEQHQQQNQNHKNIAQHHQHDDVGAIVHHHHAREEKKSNNGGAAEKPHYVLGVFCLFIAFLCWSLYLLLQRSLVKQMHLIDFLFYLYWSALAGLLTIAVFHPEGDSIFKQVVANELSPFAWMAILYAGCVQSIGTYFLVAYATAVADSSLLAALYNGLMPLMVTVEAILFLGESMDEFQVIGGGIVIAGWVCSMIAISKDGNNLVDIQKQQQQNSPTEQQQHQSKFV